jgi:aspartate 1-decarboxylase
MKLSVLKSKIHNAVVSSTNVDYAGSITIDRRLVEAAGLVEYEKVLVSNLSNGSRFETYVIAGSREGFIEVNGAAAKMSEPGDRIIVMGFALLDEEEAKDFKPRIVVVDGENRVIR